MAYNICREFLHLVFFIFSLLLLWLKITTSTSIGNQLVPAAAHYKCIDKERDALLDFKAHIDQDPYDRLSTWTTDECCKWYRVTCNNQTGHVTGLDVSDYILGGKISPSLLNLSYLSHLYLSGNSFSGTIPMFIGSMTQLRYLGLSHNYFNGTIPMFIDSMTQLSYLDLSHNYFNGTIPMFIGSMTQLTYLDLSGNSFSGTIPMFIGSMTQLSYLDLSDNGFNGTIPMFIGSMTHLSYLDLSHNYFNGTIPMFIGSMTQLTNLDLSSNSFSGTIPKSIGALTKLTILDLSYNNLLNGTCIPQELGNLTNMQHLLLRNLSSCTVENIDWLSHMSDLNFLKMDDTSLAKADKWVNVILSLKKLSYLSLSGCDLSQVMHPYSSSSVNSSSASIDTLYLDDNNLNSSMYNWLRPLTSNELRVLDLSGNMLDSKSFGNLCSLTYLDFTDNFAVVNLPDFLNNWSGCRSVALLYMYASYSHFTGSLSDQIQKFSYLRELYFDHNELNGSISEKVWELPNLLVLDISSNYLREAISENIGKSKISNIDLSNNSITGVLSESHMSNVSYIHHIDLSSCNLGPRFPKWIQNLKNLTQLDIANSRISDTIPVEFWNTWPSQLQYLNLSANNISGEVPDLVSNFDSNSFPIIDLSSNNFYGHIPKIPSALRSLDLSRNKFHGGISFLCEISDWGYFNQLDLSHNSFTGKLPDCLWHFTELVVLNLRNNNLSGRLPASIDLIRLVVLSLYNNKLSGELPVSLKNCTRLTFLDLGANKFTGNVPPWTGESLSELYVLSLKSNQLLGYIPLQLCQLANIQILDLSMNNLYGTIPSCLNNLTTMVQEEAFNAQNIHELSNQITRDGMFLKTSIYVDQAMFYWLGNTQEFNKNLGFLKVIDLSRNNLTGHIPYELTDLHGLIALNLSSNALDGNIPWKIGEMRNLLALDVSRNNLSGKIPVSMSNMHFLSYLDVSVNNLSGRIPSGTQLQTFDPSRYTGNAGLCGLPLTKFCPGDKGSEAPPVAGESEDYEKATDDLQKWFYIGGATGFPIGFWIVCGTLLLNRRSRHAFFHFLESLQDMIYVKVVVFIAKLKRFACK